MPARSSQPRMASFAELRARLGAGMGPDVHQQLDPLVA